MLKHLRSAHPGIRDNLPLLTVEVLSIFLSVLLAFSVDQWRDARAIRKTGELALANIELEIRRNRDEVAAVLEVHRERLPQIAGMQRAVNTDKSAFEWYLEALGNQNPRIPLLERSAWEAAVASGAVQGFDYDTLTRLSALYRRQELGLEDHTEALSELLWSPDLFDRSQAPQQYLALLVIMQSMQGNEQGFLMLADSVLTDLSRDP